MTRIFRKLLPDTFVVALIATVGLATLVPASGLAAIQVNWAANVAVVMLFFFVGAKLSRESILGGLAHWRLHVVILLSTFIMFPILGLIVARLGASEISPPIVLGILFLAALPSTVQSSIALTSIARGNVAAAIAAASASQLIGVVATPFILGLLANVHDAEISFAGLGKVAVLILLPFLVGHLSRPVTAEWVADHKKAISLTDRGTILLAVYSAFSAAVLDGIWQRLPLGDLVRLLAICLIMLAVALLFTYAAARLLKFDRSDQIAIVFCGTKKSLVQGVPMARVLFSGPDLGFILLPIMIFHQIQLMVCALIARHYAETHDNV